MPRTVFNDNTLVDRAQGLWELFVGGGRQEWPVGSERLQKFCGGDPSSVLM